MRIGVVLMQIKRKIMLWLVDTLCVSAATNQQLKEIARTVLILIVKI